MNKGTYTIKTQCSNCGQGEDYGIEVLIPLGCRIDDWLRHEECPNCKCSTLRKQS